MKWSINPFMPEDFDNSRAVKEKIVHFGVEA